MSTDAEVAGGSARLEDPIEAANHYFDYLDEHQMGLHGGGSGTNHATDADTGTGTDTTLETGNDVVVAGNATKKKRTRRQSELGIGQIVVTEMHPKKLSQRSRRKHARAGAINLDASSGKPPTSTMRG